MNSWVRRALVALTAAGVFVFFFVPIHPADSGAVGEKHLSLETPGAPMPGVLPLSVTNIPPDCSSWHELWPAFCGTSHQDGYVDNGDGAVNACDGIILDGVMWHVIWSGPTYYMTCFPPTGGDPVPVIYEPFEGPHDPGNPICENWTEVHPNFGGSIHIDDWADNDNSGSLSPCDEVWSDMGTVLYHIDDIGFDIIVDPDTGTPTKSTTWGLLKRGIFGDNP